MVEAPCFQSHREKRESQRREAKPQRASFLGQISIHRHKIDT